MNQPVKLAGATRAFYGLLFLSGFASLMYEVLWTRQLLSTFGATVYASGTVLTAFMMGMALGSFVAGRFIDRLPWRPLTVYAWLELGIGLYALAFPLLLGGVTSLHISVYHDLGSSFAALTILRFLMATVLLLIPSFFMGATLPALTRHKVLRVAGLTGNLGRLYAMNTFGAAVGTFLTGYLLIEAIGIRKATLTGAVINILVFGGAMLLQRRLASGDGVAEPAAAPQKQERKPKGGAAAEPERVDSAVVLAAIAFSGFCALGYEVLWARVLVYILGNFVHSFSLMLTAFLVGIALGSALLGSLMDRLRRPVLTFALFQAAIALLAIVLLPIFGVVLEMKESILASYSFQGSLEEYQDPWWSFTAWKLGVTFLLMLAPTLLMGASFPLAASLTIKNRDQIASGVGKIYALNTTGAILGSFSASFLLIPWIGLRGATLLFAGVNLAGAWLLLARRGKRWQPGPAVGAAAAAAAVIAFALAAVPANIFSPIYASAEKNKELIYVDEAVSGTVTIHETSGGFRVIDINGLNVAGTKFGFLCTQKLQAHFPLLMHADPKAVMQIGFGTGGTCFSVAQHPEVNRVDCVEINPGVIEAAPFFYDNNFNILDNPKVSVTIEDARNYVLATDRKYDVILSDSIHPRFTGNGLLYTEDYFEICSRVLKDDGIFSTWLPTSFLGDEEFRMIVRSMQSAFPHVLVWYMNNTIEGYTITMASKKPFQVDWDQLAERMAHPEIVGDLAEVHVANPHDLLDMIILSGPVVSDYLGEGPLNTEDRPLIEFRAPRNMNREITEFRVLERILDYRNFPDPIMASWGQDREIAEARRAGLIRYYNATTHILVAHQFHVFGQVTKEAQHLAKAMEINPDDLDAPFLAQRLVEMTRGRRSDW